MTPTLPQLQDAIHNAPVTDHQTTRQDVELTITLPVTLAWDSEEHDDGRHISIRAATVTPEDLAKAVSEALEDYRNSTEIERKEYP